MLIGTFPAIRYRRIKNVILSCRGVAGGVRTSPAQGKHGMGTNRLLVVDDEADLCGIIAKAAAA